jgi:integrase
LPIDEDLVTALKSYALRVKAERLAARPAYESSDLVVVDELGRPIRPEHYSDLFRSLTAHAGVRSIRLREVRQTCGTLMHLRGVPTAMVSMWLGHSSVAFTARTYVHGQAELLGDAGRVLADLRRGAQQRS